LHGPRGELHRADVCGGGDGDRRDAAGAALCRAVRADAGGGGPGVGGVVVAGDFDRGAVAGVVHHGAGGDDDRGVVVGAPVLRAAAIHQIRLRDDGVVVRQRVGGRDADEFRGAAGVDGGGRVGVVLGVHDGVFRLEGGGGYRGGDVGVLGDFQEGVRRHGGAGGAVAAEGRSGHGASGAGLDHGGAAGVSGVDG